MIFIAFFYCIFHLFLPNRFNINAGSGEIRTGGALDYEQQSQYVFLARVIDSGNPSQSSTIQVTVNVNDLNDNIPLFVEQVYTGEVVEGQAGIAVTRSGSTDDLRLVVRLYFQIIFSLSVQKKKSSYCDC